MNREVKRRSLAEFESLIYLPMAYFVKGENFCRIAYHIHDRYHYITAATPHEWARLFKRAGKIESYSIVGEHVTMYRKEIRTAIGRRYEPIMYAVLISVTLDEMELTREEAIKVAALDYWDKAKEKMSAKVINMFSSVVKRIA